ncbi:periplasmic heavy metal sensor [Ponticaulis koreensis]|uniref:periplasmic heavy metal sensor n=1 Tax=Ponticaulis koreensis TaxID=1123045 RepID=UPI0003B664EF|nr:periplasmic heavy metal sensor [Ponticaulis koreensis]
MSDTKRPFPTLLVVSLCVNAIVLGFLGGTLISDKQHNSHQHADHQHGEDNRGSFEERLARAALRDLPDEQREEMQEMFSERWRNARDLRDQMAAARGRIAELLAAESLDDEALTAAFAEVREAEFRLRTQFYASLTDTLIAVPTERRADLVERAMLRREREDYRRARRDGDFRRPPPPGHSPDSNGPRPPPRD